MLYNVTAIFEGDSIQKTEAYVGNIEPGKSGNVDTMISGVAATADDGKISLTITYEDENGVVTPMEKEIQLFVTEPVDDMDSMIDVGNIDEVETDTSFMGKYKKYAVPAGAGAFLLLVLIIVLVKRRKKKAGMDDEIL